MFLYYTFCEKRQRKCCLHSVYFNYSPLKDIKKGSPTWNIEEYHPMLTFCKSTIDMIYMLFPGHTVYHYMDDILLSDSNVNTLEKCLKKKILI